MKFDYTNKWYMHNLESFQENKTQKPFRYFELQTNLLILARRTELMIVNKKKKKKKKKRTCRIVDFAAQADQRVKLKESEKGKKKRQVRGTCLVTEKTTEHQNNCDTSCNWCSRYNHQGLVHGVETLEEDEKRPSNLQHY